MATQLSVARVWFVCFTSVSGASGRGKAAAVDPRNHGRLWSPKTIRPHERDSSDGHTKRGSWVFLNHLCKSWPVHIKPRNNRFDRCNHGSKGGYPGFPDERRYSRLAIHAAFLNAECLSRKFLDRANPC